MSHAHSPVLDPSKGVSEAALRDCIECLKLESIANCKDTTVRRYQKSLVLQCISVLGEASTSSISSDFPSGVRCVYVQLDLYLLLLDNEGDPYATGVSSPASGQRTALNGLEVLRVALEMESTVALTDMLAEASLDLILQVRPSQLADCAGCRFLEYPGLNIVQKRHMWKDKFHI